MKHSPATQPLSAIVTKDLLCLCRDKAGLTVLFIMPLALLLVMALVQNAVISSGPRSVRSELLVVDRDGGALAAEIVGSVASNGYYTVRREIGGGIPTSELARSAVLHGDIHACLIIPRGFSEAVSRHSMKRDMAADASGDPGESTPETTSVSDPVPPLEIILDPTLPGALREGYLNVLSRLVLLHEVRATFLAMGVELPAGAGDAGRYGGLDIRIEDGTFSGRKGTDMPTVTQQNVPAWTMFAMFFIVVPLATQMIRERNDGTLRRSLVAPVGYVSLVTGKILVYGMVCVAQFILLCAAGMTVLPWFGLASLTLGAHPGAIVPVVVAAALAACGFGVLIGTVARSHVQASSFGAVVVIILAAIGGVMVPVYVMPHYLREFSVISPLSWGLNAFLDVFMRGGSLADVLPETCGLLGFFVFTFTGAIFHRKRCGR